MIWRRGMAKSYTNTAKSKVAKKKNALKGAISRIGKRNRKKKAGG